MKREKTYRGYYRKMREHDKKYRYLVGGRSPMNMGDMKYYEYYKLRWYIYSGDVNPYGFCIALERFYKNLKYRKKFIMLHKKYNSGK